MEHTVSQEFHIGEMRIKTLVDASNHDGEFEVFEFVVNKEGVGPDLHLHRQMDEIIYVISGELMVTCGDKSSHLKAGDRIFLPKNIPHIWKSHGLQPLKMMVIFSPTNSQKAFFKELEESIHQKHSWAQTIDALAKKYDVVPLG